MSREYSVRGERGACKEEALPIIILWSGLKQYTKWNASHILGVLLPYHCADVIIKLLI